MDPKLSYAHILDSIDNLDVVAYTATRNHLSGTVSKLSPYITRGVIDLPTIRDRILTRYSFQQAEKFIQELAWREYFQKVWFAKGAGIFSDLRFPRTDWAHNEIVQVISKHATRITVIDKSLDELTTTGHMHNHARMWTAMLACNVAKAHWFEMGRFLYYHLIDGDLASNMLSWQWVAGTSVSKRYVANQELINVCSNTTQTASYLDLPREQVGRGTTPTILLPHEPFIAQSSYPVADPVPNLAGQTVFLYHPWSLDPLWYQTQTGVRILVIEPRLFDRFPVSPLVMEFIITAAKAQIPNIIISVGNVQDLPSIEQATNVYSKQYPATTDWPGVIDPVAELFPTVTGYFPSFFTFWQACLKTL